MLEVDSITVVIRWEPIQHTWAKWVEIKCNSLQEVIIQEAITEEATEVAEEAEVGKVITEEEATWAGSNNRCPSNQWACNLLHLEVCTLSQAVQEWSDLSSTLSNSLH